MTSAHSKARIEKQVVIMDLSGLSLTPRGVALALFKETLRIDQEYVKQ